MNRLKFLLFAVVTLGLWGYHLVVSPAASLALVEQGAGALAAAGPAVALKVEGQRAEAQSAIMRVANSPAASSVGPKATGKLEAPPVERFAAVRPLVFDLLAEENRATVVIALVNEQGVLFAQGIGEPSAAPQGFDLATVAQAGAAGAIAPLNGVAYVFYSTPMLVADKNFEVRGAGTAVVGLPLLPDTKQLEALAKDLRLGTLAVVSGGTVILTAGPEKVQAEAATRTLKAGQVTALVSGSVRAVGPLAFPLFVDRPAHSVGARQAIGGTAFEVVAVTSTREPLEALAEFQLFGVAGLAGLLVLALAVLLLIKPEEEEGGGMAMPPPMPVPPMARKEVAPMVVEHHGSGPEASPDDFHFPATSPSSFAISGPSSATAQVPPPPQTGSVPSFVPAPSSGSVATQASAPAPVPSFATAPAPAFVPPPAFSFAPPPPEPAVDPFGEPQADPFAVAVFVVVAEPPSPARAPAPVAPPPRPSSRPPMPSANAFGEDEHERTVAYPVYKPTAPAYSPGPSSSPSTVPFPVIPLPGERHTSLDDNGDATRVAAVPQELIRAARGGASAPPAARPPSMPKAQSAVGAAAFGETEEMHFQDVFRDFVTTREKCSEPADGLTFEKFKAKLLKNKEQLVQKYQCRTVRFQVYVKEGKAALKATPVKD